MYSYNGDTCIIYYEIPQIQEGKVKILVKETNTEVEINYKDISNWMMELYLLQIEKTLR